MFAEDQQQQEDECVALDSIYGPDVFRRSPGPCVEFGFPSLDASPSLRLRATIPSDYPSASSPVAELHSDLLDDASIATISHELDAQFVPGEVVLFTWATLLQREWELREPPPPLDAEHLLEATAAVGLEDEMQAVASVPSSRPDAGSDFSTQNAAGNAACAPANLVHGEPLTEKKSTFQAHVAHVTSVDAVQEVVNYLLTNNKIRSATHNIMAYRIERDDAPGTFIQDCDDDGEAAAGGRLLHLLQMVDARNVVVVVSRWFGGILLGPARFGLINKVARDLLSKCGMIGEKGKAKDRQKGGKK